MFCCNFSVQFDIVVLTVIFNLYVFFNKCEDDQHIIIILKVRLMGLSYSIDINCPRDCV